MANLGARNDVTCSIYSRTLLEEIDKAQSAMKHVDPVQLFFNSKLLMTCSRLYWTIGKHSESFECLRQCRLVRRYVHPASRGINCSDQAVTFLEILACVRQQDYERAYHLADEGRHRWESDRRFLIWYAIIKFQESSKWRLKPWATAIIHKLTKTCLDNHFVWYAEARCALYSQRDARRALSCLMQAIELAPKFYEAYFFRATLRRIMGSYHNALKDVRLCCEIYPKRALCWATYGYIALLIHRYQTALSCFLLTLNLKRRSKFNWMLMIRGWIFLKWEYFHYAFDDFFLLLKRNPTNLYLLKAVALSGWHFKGQKFVASLLRRYQALLPVAPTVWAIYGLSLFVQSETASYAKAVYVLQQVVHAHPLHCQARFSLGVALYWCRRPAEAVVMFDSLHDPVRVKNSHGDMDELLRIHAYAGLGISLFLVSQHARSLGILESIANTGFADSYFYLAFGCIRMAMKKPREAALAFSKACYMEKHNGEVRFIIAAIYMLYSCVKKAVAYYSMLVDSNDSRYVGLALLNRAFALSKLEEYPPAMDDVKVLKSNHPEFSAQYHLQIEALSFELRIKNRRKLQLRAKQAKRL